MHTTAFKNDDKSARLRGLIVILLFFCLWNPARSQTNDADGWKSNKLLLATVNAEVLLHPNIGDGPYQNMAYGFKIGHNTLHKLGWYVGFMSNFKFFGAFKAADESNIYPYKNSTSFMEANVGLTVHKYKLCSYHIGTGYFYKTENRLDHNYNIVHQKGTAAHGLVFNTGLTWHMELSDKYIREKNPEKLSLSVEGVAMVSFNHTSKKDIFSYGVKLGLGICSPVNMRHREPILPNDNPPQDQETTPPVIAENQENQNAEQPQAPSDAPKAQKDTKRPGRAPSVEIGVARNISEYSVEISGLVRDEGSADVSEYGFCYTRYGTPSLNPESQIVKVNSRSASFNSTINNLKSGTTYSIRAYAINKVDTSYSDIINVKTKDILSINSIYDLKPTSVTIVFTNTNDLLNSGDVVRRGLCYADSAESETPTVKDHVIQHESGAIFQTINNLEPEKRYYVRAFTEKADRTVEYSDDVTFVTPSYIVTRSITNIGSTSATAGGEIRFNIPGNIMLAGSCWSLKNPNPTTANTRTGDVISNMNWFSSMENLKPNTQYWVRAYVITDSGQVYYGNVVTFKTRQ